MLVECRANRIVNCDLSVYACLAKMSILTELNCEIKFNKWPFYDQIKAHQGCEVNVY